MNHIKSIALISAIAAASMSSTSFAADQADVQVLAAVINNCKIISTQDINFGQLDPAAATDASAQGAVTLACTKNVNYLLAADQGQNSDGSSRRMRGGANGDLLAYQLAQDSFAGVGAGFSSPATIGLDASIAGSDYKDLPADAYADTLRFTVMP